MSRTTKVDTLAAAGPSDALAAAPAGNAVRRTLTAESSFETFAGADGCVVTRFTNRRFLEVNERVLRETASKQTCSTSEGLLSRFRLEELPIDSANGDSVRVVLEGSGEPVALHFVEAGAYLYEIFHRGCCGPGDLRDYYDLRSGRLVFSTSTTPRWIPVTVSRRVFVAFADNYSAVALPDAERDSSVIGVLQVGDASGPTARVVVRGTPGAQYSTDYLRLFVDGQLTDEDALWVRARRGGAEVTIRVGLSSPTATGPDVVIDIPIPGGRPDLSRATASGAQLSM